MISSSLLVIGMFLLSQPTERNGFVRQVPPETLRALLQVSVPGEDVYFAGASEEFIYLGDLASSSMVIEIKESRAQKIEINYGSFPQAKTSKIQISPPYFFVADLVAYRIYRGAMNTWRLNEEIHTAGEFFTEFIPVSSQSVILRTYQNEKKVFTLARENYSTREWIPETPLLEKQLDGIFCTDGILSFDKSSRKVVYTYFSRNQFICADTSLHLIYRGRTIDTTFHAKIKVAAFPGTNGYAMASPPNIVNRRVCTGGNTLYINSTLVADNEDGILFNRVDVLDLYDLTDGHYLKSLFLERFQGKKLRHFLVHRNRIYTLTENTFSVYFMGHS